MHQTSQNRKKCNTDETQPKAERSESGASETTVLRGDQPWITNETAAERETTESSNTKPIAYMQALCYYIP